MFALSMNSYLKSRFVDSNLIISQVTAPNYLTICPQIFMCQQMLVEMWKQGILLLIGKHQYMVGVNLVFFFQFCKYKKIGEIFPKIIKLS